MPARRAGQRNLRQRAGGPCSMRRRLIRSLSCASPFQRHQARRPPAQRPAIRALFSVPGANPAPPSQSRRDRSTGCPRPAAGRRWCAAGHAAAATTRPRHYLSPRPRPRASRPCWPSSAPSFAPTRPRSLCPRPARSLTPAVSTRSRSLTDLLLLPVATACAAPSFHVLLAQRAKFRKKRKNRPELPCSESTSDSLPLLCLNPAGLHAHPPAVVPCKRQFALPTPTGISVTRPRTAHAWRQRVTV